ncbi:MAG: hypothetical protein JRH01_05890 [Deltaproteobacteria bacterium]|nr:hypothetical protein [Deltaproteobacteria bacterium]MBW2394714.1 hypothetical protein [Deltaproteobacteria bacterium]
MGKLRSVRIQLGFCIWLALQALVGCAAPPIPPSLMCPAFERPPLQLDAMPGVGSCVGSPAVEPWIRDLRRSIRSEWHPPENAWAMEEVRAVFVLARDGSVRDSCIRSGRDVAAVGAVLHALHAHRLERPPPPEVACLIGIRLQATFKVLGP